jgi:hypothetical protein
MTYRRSTLLGVAGALVLSASRVLAGPPDVPVTQAAAESPWEFRLEPYGWFTGLTGTTGVLGQQVPTDLSFSDIAHHLKMVFAGQFEVRYNRWGLMTDIMYADIGGYIPVRDPRIQEFALDTKLLVFQLVPNYRVWRSDKGFFDLLAGLRGWDTKLRLSGFRDVSDGEGAPDFRYFNRSDSKTWVDFVGGARVQYFLYQGLFVAAYGDIGGGSSALTWQVQGTLGYKFTKMISAELGWRTLSDNYQTGGFTYNVKQQGALLGVNFTW